MKSKLIAKPPGFSDKDLKTAKHDEILKWIDNSAEVIAKHQFYQPFSLVEANLMISGFENSLKKAKNEFAKRAKQYNGSKIKKSTIKKASEKLNQISIVDTIKNAKRPIPKLVSKEFQKLIEIRQDRSDKLKPIGYIDAVLHFHTYSHIHVSGPFSIFRAKDNHRLEFRDSVFAYMEFDDEEILRKACDSLINKEFKISFSGENTWMYIDVRSKIESIGQVIREVVTFQHYFNTPFYVASPDAGHSSILKSQGIGFIHYPNS